MFSHPLPILYVCFSHLPWASLRYHPSLRIRWLMNLIKDSLRSPTLDHGLISDFEQRFSLEISRFILRCDPQQKIIKQYLRIVVINVFSFEYLLFLGPATDCLIKSVSLLTLPLQITNPPLLISKVIFATASLIFAVCLKLNHFHG